ncbi:MAG: DNA-binding protein [Hydrocarboniphaga sp.]|uniref:DUF1294 domain-containing protein n=1 Tax=Hydrocarboniphaga sp. TaxID=2033016 RepID=UPI00261953BE|nr:DUF1294 domain-containing protein [Hydrocarboniphaga sp.]MDB5972765.1 DNA-binding protein [Hydrocarboniphaga sp.]
MRYQGKLTNWNDAKGIGTITWNGGTDRVFVHISAFTTKRRRPVANDIVTYEVERDANGRFKAVNVLFPERQQSQKAKPSGIASWVCGVVTALFVGYLVISGMKGNTSEAILGLYVIASFITVLAYISDKTAAKSGSWRTSESSLHLLALVGGWPGAYVAQRLFRHKTIKQPFQGVFMGTMVINILCFVAYSRHLMSDTASLGIR